MSSARRSPRAGKCRLNCPGWNSQTRRALEQLIDRGAGQGLPVVFDFDNTLVCGDLQEATLAVLARAGKLTAKKLPETLSPPFRVPGGQRITIESSADITEPRILAAAEVAWRSSEFTISSSRCCCSARLDCRTNSEPNRNACGVSPPARATSCRSVSPGRTL